MGTAGLNLDNGLDSCDFHTEAFSHLKEVIFSQSQNCVILLSELLCLGYRGLREDFLRRVSDVSRTMSEYHGREHHRYRQQCCT